MPPHSKKGGWFVAQAPSLTKRGTEEPPSSLLSVQSGCLGGLVCEGEQNHDISSDVRDVRGEQKPERTGGRVRRPGSLLRESEQRKSSCGNEPITRGFLAPSLSLHTSFALLLSSFEARCACPRHTRERAVPPQPVPCSCKPI